MFGYAVAGRQPVARQASWYSRPRPDRSSSTYTSIGQETCARLWADADRQRRKYCLTDHECYRRAAVYLTGCGRWCCGADCSFKPFQGSDCLSVQDFLAFIGPWLPSRDTLEGRAKRSHWVAKFSSDLDHSSRKRSECFASKWRLGANEDRWLGPDRLCYEEWASISSAQTRSLTYIASTWSAASL